MASPIHQRSRSKPSGEAELLLKLLSVLEDEGGREREIVRLAALLMGGVRGSVDLAYRLSEMNCAPGEALRGTEGLARLIMEMLEAGGLA